MSAIRLVYIAGPYRGANAWEVEENRRRAKAVAYRVARLGAFPVTPHLLTDPALGCAQDDEFWLEGDLELLRRLDAIMLCEGWRASIGSRGESRLAQQVGIPVFCEPDYARLRAWIASPFVPRWHGVAAVLHELSGDPVAVTPVAKRVIPTDDLYQATTEETRLDVQRQHRILPICPACGEPTDELRSYRCRTCRDEKGLGDWTYRERVTEAAAMAASLEQERPTEDDPEGTPCPECGAHLGFDEAACTACGQYFGEEDDQ